MSISIPLSVYILGTCAHTLVRNIGLKHVLIAQVIKCHMEIEQGSPEWSGWLSPELNLQGRMVSIPGWGIKILHAARRDQNK